WPLPTMAPLAHTLALLAMTVATAAIKVTRLDMAQDSFDDRYQGCGPAMTAALPALNHTDFQQNPLFAHAWAIATALWEMGGSRVSPLASPAQAIAVMAYTMNGLYKDFNAAVKAAGHSPQQYRDSFHFKVLHFLLTDALATLRATQGSQCHDVCRGVKGKRFEARRGDTVRFGRFTSTSLKEIAAECFGTGTIFQVHTCHGAGIQEFSYFPFEQEVLIPPFETFEVTKVTQEGDTTQIQLRSTGNFSRYNCEWLRGDTTGDSLGGM
ncbi:NARE ribosyltransferase, partial [Donacobius atricapilla]|nr:NARE ribosyltransferase [Donacobius atricapilla]